MVTVLLPKSSVLLCGFCGQNDSMPKKYFLFTVGSVSRVKPFIIRFADDEEVETEVQKRLRQQSKNTSTLRVSNHW
jgi:hypothetical protein